MIKLKDILFEQSNDSKTFTYSFEFESGKTDLTRNGRVELNKIIGQIKKLLSQNYEKETMKINVNAQESKVPNQAPYQAEGSLAKARSEMLSNELKKEFPDIEINATYVPKAQGPEWNPPAGSTPDQIQALARSEQYKQYQRVTAEIKLRPIAIEKKYIVNFAIAIPSQAGKSAGAGADLRNSFFWKQGNGPWKTAGNFNNWSSKIKQTASGTLSVSPTLGKLNDQVKETAERLDSLLTNNDINDLINSYKPGQNTNADKHVKTYQNRNWLLGMDNIIKFIESYS